MRVKIGRIHSPPQEGDAAFSQIILDTGYYYYYERILLQCRVVSKHRSGAVHIFTQSYRRQSDATTTTRSSIAEGPRDAHYVS